MIRPSKDGTKLYFVPPEKSGEQELEFDNIYSHICPKCNNLVSALFVTDKVVDPRPWEEILTHTLNKDGKYNRIIPGRNARYKSRYKVIPIGRKPSISAQMIQFSEHLTASSDPDSPEICEYLTILSEIPEFRVNDILLSLNPPLDPKNYDIKDTDYNDIRSALGEGLLLGKGMSLDWYLFSPAIGKGPEAVHMLRKAQQWGVNLTIGKYFKSMNPLSF